MQKDDNNQLIMEVYCAAATDIPENIPYDIDQKHYICIRLCLTSDNKKYNTLFMQNFLSG